LIVLFAFVGNKFDRVSTIKSSKKGAMFQGAGHTTTYQQCHGLAIIVLQEHPKLPGGPDGRAS